MKSGFKLLFLRIPGTSKFQSSFSFVRNVFIARRTVVPPVVVQNFRRVSFCNFTAITLPETHLDREVLGIESVLRSNSDWNVKDIERYLHEIDILLTDEVILNVLQRNRSGWKIPFAFFIWACGKYNSVGCGPGVNIFNEILDILGLFKRFNEFHQVLDEMRRRKNIMNDCSYAIAVGRLAAAHNVDEAIKVFENIEEFGLIRNSAAFQTLLLSLCRYKHVEEAEFLFRNHRREFKDDIKSWNIILNGWCVLRSFRDSKRVWKDIVRSDCIPDKYTYGIFINSLSKSGKITTAMNLLRKMWNRGFNPDTPICNTVIDGLCFKKRIPEALQIFNEMNDRDCFPNVATYNSLIKHMCKIQRMEKVDELIKEMEKKGGICLPNALTYGYLLQVAKTPKEVDEILERMEKSECKLNLDLYNLLLRLFIAWGDMKRVKRIWDEMERNGTGPDHRSYTIIIHGLCNKGMVDMAMDFYSEMTSKGMVPQHRTMLLIKQGFNEENPLFDG